MRLVVVKRAPKHAFRHKPARLLLAGKYLMRYRSRSMGRRVFVEYLALDSNIGLPEGEILAVVEEIRFSGSPPYRAKLPDN
jgi:hypothetical protein